MHILDIFIIITYLSLMVVTGLYFQKKASAGIDAYFLGNRRLPWWVLGASGMASNLDVSGTMINVAMIYAFGAMGFFVEIRGGIVLIMAFLMIFMGKWNRRSNVMTMAEWMQFRFGTGRQGDVARLITAIATLIITVWIITYFAVGAGKFVSEFVGIPDYLNLPKEFWAAALMITLAMIYTIVSGLYGVVWTDVFQGVLIFITIVAVCAISAVQFPLPDTFDLGIPLKDGGFAIVHTTRDAWTNILPDWQLDFPENSRYSVYNLFGIIIIFYLIKTIIEGSAGIGGYMMQRFYSARSDRDAGLLSLFWTFLLAFRWPFIAAIAIMGIHLGAQQGGIVQDPENVLPRVINTMIPVGLKGLLIAGLMAAAMSTFDSLVNAGASYWVKDIYQAYIKPDANEKQLLLHSRLASVLIVLAGLFFTLDIRSLNEIWVWVTIGIGSGLIFPTLIRWYWWRLNGYGYATGVAGGMITALMLRWLIPDLPEYSTYVLIIGVSAIATLAGTLLTPATQQKILDNFYTVTRPFGFWKPVRQNLPNKYTREITKETRRDRIATLIAVPWQMVLFLSLMTAMLQNWRTMMYLVIFLMLLSAGLYYFWYRHLNRLTITEDK